MKTLYQNLLGGKSGALGLALLALLILVILPLSLDIFRLNLVGKYLTYAFVAVGLVLLWGYGGILSLGQGMFFGLGGYLMAMFLKLEASDPKTTAIQSTPGIPDFMDWNQITALPGFWVPFNSLPFTLCAVLVVPALFAYIIGIAMFKRRVGGVYFAIITQAIALIMTILIVGQQGYTGGVNGITDLRTLLGWDIRTDSARHILYFVNAGLLLACIICEQIHPYQQVRHALAGDARQRGARTVFRLRRLQFQGVHLLCRGGDLGGGRCHVHPAGRFHVAFIRRHRAVHRNGHLHGSRRAYVADRCSVRHAAGEFRQDDLLRKFSDVVADLYGRLFIGVVMGFPNGLAGVYTGTVNPKFLAWRVAKKSPSWEPTAQPEGAEWETAIAAMAGKRNDHGPPDLRHELRKIAPAGFCAHG